MSTGSFSNVTPLKRGNGEMNCFLLFLNKDLSPKINPSTFMFMGTENEVVV